MRNAPLLEFGPREAFFEEYAMNVSDIMRRSFATIRPDAPPLEAADLLLQTNQRGLPVIDREGTLVGVISEGDFPMANSN
ncbi:HPP family protein [Bradyrhizobium sp.]|uniref:CBS domain-containing protein n=1 Tax=Bradyrhizobium sp. TaxID=376 RepID=UPI003BB08E5C